MATKGPGAGVDDRCLDLLHLRRLRAHRHDGRGGQGPRSSAGGCANGYLHLYRLRAPGRRSLRAPRCATAMLFHLGSFSGSQRGVLTARHVEP